jgi:hypothetical protein
MRLDASAPHALLKSRFQLYRYSWMVQTIKMGLPRRSPENCRGEGGSKWACPPICRQIVCNCLKMNGLQNKQHSVPSNSVKPSQTDLAQADNGGSGVFGPPSPTRRPVRHSRFGDGGSHLATREFRGRGVAGNTAILAGCAPRLGLFYPSGKTLCAELPCFGAKTPWHVLC